MKKEYENLFVHLRSAEPSPDLLNKILMRLESEKKISFWKLKIRLVCTSIVTLAVMGLFIPLWQSFQAEIAQSGFAEFLSLLSSDLNAVLTYWQDFVLSMAESLPFLTLTGILAMVFVFLFSLKYLFHDVKGVFFTKSFIL